jgi:cobalt-zinc-cadmium efflux system membrane fusion protein
LEILGLRPNETGQKLSVRATLGGKVTDLSVAPGEYRSDTNTPLMTVADLNTVWVTSEVPEVSIRFIEVGEKVQVELVAYPGDVFDARVTRIADTVDPKTRTIQVQAELSNPRGRLRPEMFGRIRHSHAPTVLPVVPAQAIVQTPEGPVVFIERGVGRYERVLIKSSDPIQAGVPVLGGVKEGDRVVTRGNMLLLNGGTR